MQTGTFSIQKSDGRVEAFNPQLIQDRLAHVSKGINNVNIQEITQVVQRSLYDGVKTSEIDELTIKELTTRIETAPEYGVVAAHYQYDVLRRMIRQHLGLSKLCGLDEEFITYLQIGVEQGLLDPKVVAAYDLRSLAHAIDYGRNQSLTYLGLTTLMDRYLIRNRERQIIEDPQHMFMRVAMGLAQNEKEEERHHWAIEFYTLLSSFDYMSSTPTLFNSSTMHPQLSSCYLTTVPDDLFGIYTAMRDNAMLSKFAGGLGNDWTAVRGLGSMIQGTNGKSQGVVPFLKVANDTAVAVNQGGKRKGAVCAYLETWHLDIEEFLDLRKNTGDDRRRTHDMNTANWIPDMFMIRVLKDEMWTLFSPSDVPQLHDVYGKTFEELYLQAEEKARKGEIKQHRRIKAVDLWRKMLSMLYETGHPWLTFKDPCNIRSPQDHVGVVHSSNLCCIAGDQRVVTDRGLLTVKELYQLGGANKTVGLTQVDNATEMFLPRPNAEMGIIHTKEGFSHKVTPDHPVWVKDRGWVEAQDLVAGDVLLLQQVSGLWGKHHDPELAFLMGMMAGDGTYYRISETEAIPKICVWEKNTSVRDHVLDCARNVVFRHQGEIEYGSRSKSGFDYNVSANGGCFSFSSKSLGLVFEHYGFTVETKTKIPEFLWSSDAETVGAYLSGLYRCDATIAATNQLTTMSLANVDRKLLEDVQILWANFGVKTSLTQACEAMTKSLPNGTGGYADYPCQALYRLHHTSIQSCRIAESVVGLTQCRSGAQVEKFLNNITFKGGYSQKLEARFTHYERIANEDAYCLTVDSETHAWTVNGFITKNTEITLNTSEEEIAVCNLGSINLVQHVDESGMLLLDKLAKTVKTAVRMLDNVIDQNYYPVPQAKTSNLRHRPIGLGIMGFQDALYKSGVSYASDAAVMLADTWMEQISYYALDASCELARERGSYESFEGSKWDRGLLPIDTVAMVGDSRPAQMFMQNTDTHLSKDVWDTLRKKIQAHGMRNSNVMAIAPTATISNICGVSQSIEPQFQNLFVKSNLSGEFTIINEWLVRDLRAIGMWDAQMINALKSADGSVQHIDRVPQAIKDLYRTAFEVEPRFLVESASRRQKWIDQAQSLNLYICEPNGKKLDTTYKMAWLLGLKTTYYLRAMSATQTEKSTVTTGELNAVSAVAPSVPMACSIDNPDCEACQ